MHLISTNSRQALAATVHVLEGGCHVATNATSGRYLGPSSGNPDIGATAVIRITDVVIREGDIEVRYAEHTAGGNMMYGLHVCRSGRLTCGYFYPADQQVSPEAMRRAIETFKGGTEPPPVWRAPGT